MGSLDQTFLMQTGEIPPDRRPADSKPISKVVYPGTIALLNILDDPASTSCVQQISLPHSRSLAYSEALSKPFPPLHN